MSVTADLIAANQRYAATFTKGSLTRNPVRKVAILTCMDARLDPAKALGLEEGDAHVIRNAGGRASDDALRSLIVSHNLNDVREIVVLHHTDCGLNAITDDAFRARLRERHGFDPSRIALQSFRDLDESVRDDMLTIRSSTFLPNNLPISGFVYDVATGLLRQVD